MSSHLQQLAEGYLSELRASNDSSKRMLHHYRKNALKAVMRGGNVPLEIVLYVLSRKGLFSSSDFRLNSSVLRMVSRTGYAYQSLFPSEDIERLLGLTEGFVGMDPSRIAKRCGLDTRTFFDTIRGLPTSREEPIFENGSRACLGVCSYLDSSGQNCSAKELFRRFIDYNTYEEKRFGAFLFPSPELCGNTSPEEFVKHSLGLD